MTRNEELIELVQNSMGDSQTTWQELLKMIQLGHRDVKHVYGIRDLDKDIKSISVKCHDRTIITFNFERQSIEPPSSWSIPISM